jgi:hypothetical protein
MARQANRQKNVVVMMRGMVVLFFYGNRLALPVRYKHTYVLLDRVGGIKALQLFAVSLCKRKHDQNKYK